MVPSSISPVKLRIELPRNRSLNTNCFETAQKGQSDRCRPTLKITSDRSSDFARQIKFKHQPLVFDCLSRRKATANT